jgi:hypothetical protein
VSRGHLDQDDPHAVRILDLHLDQPPRLGNRLAHDRNTGGGQPDMLRADVPHLDPDHHRTPRRPVPVPGDLQQALSEKEHQPGIVRRPELPVHGQAQDIAVEPAAPIQAAWSQQDPAAQNVHAPFQHHT